MICNYFQLANANDGLFKRPLTLVYEFVLNWDDVLYIFLLQPTFQPICYFKIYGVSDVKHVEFIMMT